MKSLDSILKERGGLKIEVFACSIVNNTKILQKCLELKVRYVPKPVIKPILVYMLKPYLPANIE